MVSRTPSGLGLRDPASPLAGSYGRCNLGFDAVGVDSEPSVVRCRGVARVRALYDVLTQHIFLRGDTD